MYVILYNLGYSVVNRVKLYEAAVRRALHFKS
jgi:hypothetical protein